MSEESSGGGEVSTSAEGSVESTETSKEASAPKSIREMADSIEDDEPTPKKKPEPKKEEPMTAAEKRKYKLMIDGAEEEVDEDEVVRRAQKASAADKRFQEAQLARKQNEEFVRLLKADPRKVLSHPSIGHDLKKFAEDILLEQLQEEMMDPKDKELRDYKAKLEKYEAQERKAKEEAEAKQKEEVRNKYKEDYNKQIIDALEVSGLPKTEYTVQRMVYYMAKALEHGYEMSAMDVKDLVKRDYINDTKSLYSGLNGDALLSILGEDVVKKLKSEDIKKVKGFKNNLEAPVELDGEGSTPRKPKKLSQEDWRAEILKRANG